MKKETENFAQLKELALEMSKLNPSGFVSGGTALKLQGIKTRREPQDLDFVFGKFTLDYAVPEDYDMEDSDIDYPEDYRWQRETWTCKDRPKIDILMPRALEDVVHIDQFVRQFYDLEEDSVARVNVPMVHSLAILQFKLHHALDENSSASRKHRLDLIYLLTPNSGIKLSAEQEEVLKSQAFSTRAAGQAYIDKKTKPKFEVGKVYTSDLAGIFFCTKISEHGNLYGYGFSAGGEWFSRPEQSDDHLCACNATAAENLKEADPGKWEDSLIEEAEKKYPKGTKFVSLNEGKFVVSSGAASLFIRTKTVWNLVDKIGEVGLLFEDGKWADVVADPEALYRERAKSAKLVEALQKIIDQSPYSDDIDSEGGKSSDRRVQ